MLKDGTREDTIICAYRESTDLAWHYVQSQDIVKAVKDAIPATKANH